MRILVVGAGATGGYFGARLALAGRDVTFLVREGRVERLRAHGLAVASPHGDFVVHPRVVTAATLDGPYDLVVLAVKAYSLASALDDLEPAMGPQSLVLPLLNGRAHLKVLADRLGDRVLGGLCRINTTEDGGRIVQFNGLHELWYGELDGGVTARVRAVDRELQGAGFDARLAPSIQKKLWEKWTLLVTMGSVVCLMRGNLGEVARAPGGVGFAEALFAEVCAVATAAGFAPDPEFVAVTRSWLGDPTSTQTTSMYRDLVQGRTIEADQIVGDFCAQAHSLGVPTPLVSAAWVHLSVYQNRRQG